MNPRRTLLAALAFSTVAVLSWTGLWHLAASKMRVAATRWIEAERALGFQLEHGGIEVRGFPFRLELRVEAPVFGGGARWPDASWRGGAVEIEIRPWNLSRFELRAPGSHRVEITLGAFRRAVLLDASEVRGTLALGGGGALESARLEIREAETGIEGQPNRYQFAGLDLELRFPPASGADAPSLVVRAALDQLGLPAAIEPPLGHTVERFAADLAVMGAVPPGPLASAVESWRQAGGTIEIRRLAGGWGPLSVEGDGAAALDRDLQPMGSFALRVAGYEEALDALVAAGAVRPTAAAAVKVILNLISKPGADGAAEAAVPVSFQAGELFVGPAALLSLPRLRWE